MYSINWNYLASSNLLTTAEIEERPFKQLSQETKQMSGSNLSLADISTILADDKRENFLAFSLYVHVLWAILLKNNSLRTISNLLTVNHTFSLKYGNFASIVTIVCIKDEIRGKLD